MMQKPDLKAGLFYLPKLSSAGLSEQFTELLT